MKLATTTPQATFRLACPTPAPTSAPNQLHRLKPLPRLSLRELEQQPWGTVYREPFILTGAMDSWDLQSLRFEHLAQAYPR